MSQYTPSTTIIIIKKKISVSLQKGTFKTLPYLPGSLRIPLGMVIGNIFFNNES
jgi:hypothetical protein